MIQSDKDSNTIQFSPLIIGTMRLGDWGVNMDTDELEHFIDACLDLGLNDFDHADIYGHYTEEERFGRVIKRRSDLKSKIQVTTKCGIQLTTPNRPDFSIKSYNSTKKHIIWSAENSLKQLGLDCLDLLLIHRPDYLMNPHEIAEAFEILKKEGKVKTFGASNFTVSQFDLLNSLTPLVTHQIEVSILHLDAFTDGTLDQCMKLGIRPTAWSPFGGGVIFTDSEDESALAIHKVLKVLKEKYSAQADQVLLAFVLKHPSGIITVMGTSKIERIEAAQKALEIDLSHEDWYKLHEAATGKEVA